MKAKNLIIIILLFSFFYNSGEAKDDSSSKVNLKGWSLYHKNKNFDDKQLYQDGVVPREKVIKDLKNNKIRSLSDERCFSLLTKTKINNIPKFEKIPEVEKLDFCLKAVNYSSELFFHVYSYVSKIKKVQLLNLLKKEVY